MTVTLGTTTHRTHRTHRTRLASVAVCGSLVLLLAACSSSDDDDTVTPGAASTGGSSDAGVTAAQAALDAASKDPVFGLTAPAFALSAIKGKKIFNIPNSSAIPYIGQVDAESAKITKTYGATWIEFTNQGSPTEHTTGIDQAISQKADLIVLAQGINGELLLPALQRAKAAGIPVLITHTYQTGTPIPTALAGLVAGQVTGPFNEAATLIADYAIADTKGKADALIITSSEVPPSNGMVAAMKAELAKNCPSCKAEVINVPTTEWATKIASEVQSAMQTNPNVNYVMPVYDSMSLFVNQAITASGKTGKVKIASFNGTPEVMKLIQDGDTMAMDVGENISWLAYSTLDQAGRILTGTGPVADGNQMTPLKVFTDANIDAAGTPPEPGKGYGTAYTEGYTKLWGAP